MRTRQITNFDGTLLTIQVWHSLSYIDYIGHSLIKSKWDSLIYVIHSLLETLFCFFTLNRTIVSGRGLTMGTYFIVELPYRRYGKRMLIVKDTNMGSINFLGDPLFFGLQIRRISPIPSSVISLCGNSPAIHTKEFSKPTAAVDMWLSWEQHYQRPNRYWSSLKTITGLTNKRELYSLRPTSLILTWTCGAFHCTFVNFYGLEVKHEVGSTSRLCLKQSSIISCTLYVTIYGIFSNVHFFSANSYITIQLYN